MANNKVKISEQCGFLGVHNSINFLGSKIKGSAEKQGSIPLHQEDAQPLKEMACHLWLQAPSVPSQLKSKSADHLDGLLVPTTKSLHWEREELTLYTLVLDLEASYSEYLEDLQDHSPN